MIDRIKAVLTILDLPSGVILGIHTLAMIGLSISAFVAKRPVDGSIIAIYGVVLGAFAVNKTSKSILELKHTSTTGTPPPDEIPKI